MEVPQSGCRLKGKLKVGQGESKEGNSSLCRESFPLRMNPHLVAEVILDFRFWGLL